jgi:hypothetical protein
VEVAAALVKRRLQCIFDFPEAVAGRGRQTIHLPRQAERLLQVGNRLLNGLRVRRVATEISDLLLAIPPPAKLVIRPAHQTRTASQLRCDRPLARQSSSVCLV